MKLFVIVAIVASLIVTTPVMAATTSKTAAPPVAAKKVTTPAKKTVTKTVAKKKVVKKVDPNTLVTYIKLQDGKLVSSYQADKVLPPASMTKLMTALVILDQNPDWSKKITITQEYLDYPKIFVGNDATSEVKFKLGDTVSVYDLWVAMLVASSNQSARALVDAVGVPYDTFLLKMNQKAKDLGLKKTIFKDVAGLSENTVTTAREMAVIADAAFSQSAILRASQVHNYTIVATTADGLWHSIAVTDRNYSLQAFAPDAAKVGFLVEAQRTVSIKKGNAIVVVMHAMSMAQRNSILQKLLAT